MFNLPSSIKIIEQEKNYGKFEIEGLYPGYGVTIGNALRRVLFSSIEGAAVTSFKIKGVHHEFSTINYVSDTVLDIMLNLKQLRVKLYSNEPQVLKLKVEGKKKVYAKDFEANSMVDVMNPDLYIIAITDKKGKMEMEVVVEKGLGYSQIEERKEDKIPIGTIAVDAIFSPVRKVNFQVENMRVGGKTDYNRLIISIETDGSVSPKEALNKASAILKDYFINIEEKFIPELREEKKSTFKKEGKEPKDILIKDLDLGSRTKKALTNNGVKTLAGLLRYTEENLSIMDGLGKKSLEEIKAVLKNLKYTLK
ncbi:MAG: DNA-directed RNA polymerase subunit alpha [Candidatus Pacebacteria bacterium]|nr:DNA-directed RNA polymerase subunit alpha [Candidatus Paceibacterota bacterium]